MAKRLKLRISRLITASLQSCRLKDPSILPVDPVPSFFFQLPTGDPKTIMTKPPSITASKPHGSSFKSHVSSAFTSVGCGSRSKSDSPGDNCIQSQLFHWRQNEEEWQLVNDDLQQSPRRKPNHDKNRLATLPPPLRADKKKKIKRRNTKKKTTSDPHHRRSMKSPTDSTVVFSSEEMEREETETLVSSSRSFSTDSSTEFSPRLRTMCKKPNKTRKKKKKKRSRGCGSNSIHRLSVSSPARLSVFKKLIPEAVVEGKVKESFAVVKKSEDPYQDFKKSMMDMIWEKEMFEEGELEQLLECFLSLNSPRHHEAIIEAFAEIWNAMFSTASTSNRNSNAVSTIEDHRRSSS